jgi:DNA-binding CsgD family transcriptional regulator
LRRVSSSQAIEPRLISRAVLFEEFAGREKELAHLVELREHTARYLTGSLASISGEAGVGKSRLLSELSLAVSKERGAFVRVRCEELPVAFAPVVDAMQALSPLRDLRKVSTIGDAISRLTQGHPESGGSGQEQRAATTAAVLKAFDEASRRLGQLTLAVDDVHWSDSATLGVLGALARAIGKLPMLLIVTYRPQEIAGDHARGALIGAIERERADRLVLEPLSFGEMGDLIRRRLPDATEPVLRRVYDLSGGLPYFAEELTRSVVERGTSFDPAANLQLRSSLLGRLSTLTQAERAILDRAAVLGRNFRSEDLLALGKSEHDVRSALREGFALQILEEREVAGQPWFRFRHALTREVVYREILGVERQALHLAIANHLEEHSSRVTEFAHHISLGGDRHRALAANERAGDHVAALGGFSDAAKAYEAALKLATDIDDEVRLGKKYIHALVNAADMERLEAAALDLSKRFERAGRVEDGFEIVLNAAKGSQGFDVRRLEIFLELAASMISERTPPDQRFHFEVCRANNFRLRGRTPEALAACERAEIAASSIVHHNDRMQLLLMRMRVNITRSAKLSEELAREAERRLAARDWDSMSEGMCHTIVARAAFRAGDNRKALERFLAAIEAWGPGEALVNAYEQVGWISAKIGRFDTVRAVAERMEREGRMPGEDFSQAVAILVRACGGNVSELGTRLERAIEAGLMSYADVIGGNLAFILEADRERARSIAVRVFEMISAEVLCRGNIVHAVVEFGSDEEARRAIEMLPEAFDPELHTAGDYLIWTLARARYARKMHRPLEQKQLALQALELALPTASWTHISAAYELSGDLAGARAVLESIGASAELERFDRRHRATAGVASIGAKLTRREEQIARAIASGATNREVAERLSIGVRTVESHLVNVYAKLGISTRSQLADFLEAGIG